VRRLLILLLAIPACARPEAPSTFRAKIGAVGPLDPLAPSLRGGFSNLINPLVFQSLVTPTRKSELTSSIVADLRRLTGSRFRFSLPADAVFSDGTAVGRDDILRALEGRASLTASERGFELALLDPHEPAELLEAMVSRSTPFGVFGTGPFAIVNQSDQSILLRRRKSEPRHIHEVELISFATPRDAFAAALRGEINMILMPSDGELELLGGVRSLKVVHGPGLQSLAVIFNAHRMSLEERRTLARDLPTAELSAAFGAACSLRGTESRGSLGEGRALDIAAYDGFQAFRPATLSLRRSLGERAGRIAFVQSPSELRSASAGAFDLTVTLVQNWPTEMAIARWLSDSPFNWGGYSNPKFDEAFRAGDMVRAQAELEEDPPAVLVCDLDRTAIVDARLKNATLGDYDLLDTLPDWEVAP
jgi:hypothetical protein